MKHSPSSNLGPVVETVLAAYPKDGKVVVEVTEASGRRETHSQHTLNAKEAARLISDLAQALAQTHR